MLLESELVGRIPSRLQVADMDATLRVQPSGIPTYIEEFSASIETPTHAPGRTAAGS